VRKSSAETLLAQFTSRDNAISIVGDVAELSLGRRRGWFTSEVIRLVVSFWIRSVLAAPGRAVGYAGVGLAVYFGVYAISFIASGLLWFPWYRTHEWGFSLRLWAVVFVSNLLTGAILNARLSPGRTQAIASLMLLWVIAALIWPLFALRIYPWSWWPSAIDMPWTFVLAVSLPPLLYVVPLTIGVVASRKLFVAPRQVHS
jgi:hypothetical protein